MKNRFSQDPRWITVKYMTACQNCGAKIWPKSQAFYYPASKSLFCESDDCGGQHSRDFEAARFDEDQYNSY